MKVAHDHSSPEVEAIWRAGDSLAVDCCSPLISALMMVMTTVPGGGGVS